MIKALSYRDRNDLARLIVQTAPRECKGIKVVQRLSPDVVLVDFASKPLQTLGYISIESISKALGIGRDKIVPPKEVHGMSSGQRKYLAYASGKVGFVVLK